MSDLKKIFEMLQDPFIDLTEAEKELRFYYEEHHRHQYSEITKIVLEIYNSNDDNSEAVPMILENLKLVIRELNYDADNAFYDSLNKLVDHIKLEVVRFEEINAKIGDTKKIKSNIEAYRQQSFFEIKNVESELDEAADDLDKLKRELKNQQTQYVTILSIFATIVVTFTGGIAFSGSVLENIDTISPYRLAAVIIGLGFILFNVIYLLTWLILKINDKEKESINKAILYIVNGILIIAICITYGLYKDSALDKQQINDNTNASASVHIEYNLNNNLNGSN